MFTFIHTYTPESWEGLIRNGLWRDGDGLKLMHTVGMPEEASFNRVLAPGSQLFRKLEELRCPFYVDRLQGGVGLPRWYRFDPAVIHRLIDLLGEDFWGWQIHEWSSNYRSDIGRISDLYRSRGTPVPSPEERRRIWDGIRSGKIPLFLEALTREEWSGRREPLDRRMFLEDTRWLYAMRAAMTGYRLIPADSYHMAPRTEIEYGAGLLLPEMGWQIPNARIQTAYARGMARSAGIRWGIYYECWCYNHAVGALTIPHSLRRGQDEWFEDQVTKGTGADRTPEEREEGGTSRNLQERLWRYAYLSGAEVMAEEYGVCNTFRDYRDFDLSPYGKTKKDFLSFTERFPDPGEAFTPIAVVLPKDLPVLHVDLPDDYLGYPAGDTSDGPDPQIWKRIRETLPEIFGRRGERGNNAHVLTPGGLPDVFDILHEDQEEALRRYSFFIDLTGRDSFRKTHRTVAPEEADRILDGLLPLRIGNGIHTEYNRVKGGWLVFASNNDGMECDNFKGDVRLEEASLTAEISRRDDRVSVRMLDGSGVVRRDKDKDFLELRAGDWVLLGVSES